MHDPHSNSAITTYGIGVVATTIAQTSMNDWLVFFSLLLVVLRIGYETHDFIMRRADRRKLLGRGEPSKGDNNGQL